MAYELRFTDIDWDVDGQDPADLGLGEEVVLDGPDWIAYEDACDMIADGDTDELVDLLSDETGWCVFSCNIEAIPVF